MADINAVISLFGDFIKSTEKITKPIDQVEKLNKITGNVANQFQKGEGAIESYVQLNAKLQLMTNSLEEHAQLQDKIFSAANKARTSYADMVNTVTKLGSSTGNLFNSNQEVVSFAELLQKSLVASGTSDNKKPEVIQQITDALSKGNMGSSDLVSIAQTAPVLYDAIADATGKSGEELLNFADQGNLTAEIIKNSMFLMQTEIENKLSQMPITFSDIMNNVKNAGTDAFGNLFIAINDLMTNQSFIDFVNGIINDIYLVGNAIDNLIGTIKKYWPYIESVLMSIGLLITMNIIRQLPIIIGQLTSLLPILLTNLGVFIAANIPIILLGAGIATVIFLFRIMGEVIMSVFTGILAIAISFFINIIFVAIQLIIGLIEFVFNILAALANFIDNFLKDPIGAIIQMFFDLADIVLNVLEKLASALDLVFGSKFANAVKGWRADLKVMADAEIKEKGNGKYSKTNPEVDLNQLLSNAGISMNRINYEEKWDKGYALGGELGKGIENFLGGNPDSSKNTDPSNNNKANAFNINGMDLSSIMGMTNNNTDKSKNITNTDSKDLTNLINKFLSSYDINGKDKDKSGSKTKEKESILDLLNTGNYTNLGMNNTGTNNFLGNNNPLSSGNNGVSGAVNVEMPDDDLDYLRTIAERDYIANVATNSLAPNISVQFGDVHENADANKVAGRIREILQNEIAMASEGVY